MKKSLQDFLESEGYEFTWETQCLECYEDFRCEEFIPDAIIKKMLKEKDDGCVSEFVNNSSDNKFMHCPKCRKKLEED